MDLHPEATITKVDGGYIVHLSRDDGEEIAHDAYVRLTFTDAMRLAAEHFVRFDKRLKKELETAVI